MSAVHYFAAQSDQWDLLDYIGEPVAASLHPWPLLTAPPVSLRRDEALARHQVVIAHRDYGPPVVVRKGDPAMSSQTKSGVFNRLNWDCFTPTGDQGIVDSNASPVLFWTPGGADDTTFYAGHVGSQADSMSAISRDYERWVNRVIGWVRRKGTKVWGLERSEVRPDLDINLTSINNVYALPGALSAMEQGAAGRDYRGR